MRRLHNRRDRRKTTALYFFLLVDTISKCYVTIETRESKAVTETLEGI